MRPPVPFTPRPLGPLPPGVVAIVLSTYNGAAFLPAQLESFPAQDGVPWRLYWRDDGSVDGSAAIMHAFEQAQDGGAGRCVRVDEAGHMGVTASYMALLRAAVADGATVVAFSDQDDVWLPHKLARSLQQLGPNPEPGLYCSRQLLVDADLREICASALVRVRPGLGPALTQNIATGCTVLMNQAAAALVARSEAPGPTLHDWWSYLVVAAAGGRIVTDPEPTVLYRQHGHNAVGAPPSDSRRAVAALRRGPHVFMQVFRAHVAALQAQPGLLSPEARRTIDSVARGLSRGPLGRTVVFGHRLRRQTWAETLLFRCWFLVG